MLSFLIHVTHDSIIQCHFRMYQSPLIKNTIMTIVYTYPTVIFYTCHNDSIVFLLICTNHSTVFSLYAPIIQSFFGFFSDPYISYTNHLSGFLFSIHFYLLIHESIIQYMDQLFNRIP